MKILLHCPDWGNRWIPYFKKELSRYDLTVTHSMDDKVVGPMSEEADVLISMWLSEAIAFWSHCYPHKKIISYCRRYEVWQDESFDMIDFNPVNAVIFVSDYIRRVFLKRFTKGIPPKTYLIPNGVNLDEFPLRGPMAGTNKIALACMMKGVKNIPMAFQILKVLPKRYTLYHVGVPKDWATYGELMSYMHKLGLGNRFFQEGYLKPEYMEKWFQDKDFILSTSISEGNPVNVLEAMAMGIKPVIHAWPGARDQFPEAHIFETVDQAVNIIQSDEYNAQAYRHYVEIGYSTDNYQKIHGVIEEVCDDKV